MKSSSHSNRSRWLEMTRLLVSAAALGIVSPATADETPAIVSKSPFLPETYPVAHADSAAGPRFRLAGIVSGKSQTFVGITDVRLGVSQWIGVGQSAGGIDVVAYHATTDEVVIRADGATHTLHLQSSSQRANTPLDYRLNRTAPPFTSQPPQRVVEEREARMLVGDLLQISTEARKTRSRAPAAEPPASLRREPATPSSARPSQRVD